MSKKREVKAAITANLKEKLGRSIITVLADYRGMNVADMTDLRRKLREAGVEFKVVKNTLTRRAAQELGIEGLDPYLEGPTAAAFSEADPVAPVKILLAAIREGKSLKLKGGVLQGKAIGEEGVKALATLPPREQLLAQVVGGIQAPLVHLVSVLSRSVHGRLQELVYVLSGNLRNLVYCLDAIRKQKEGTA
ncbi:MAG TPA: 50S ribosomal protein L10 [Moorella mulderi]|nr:50S ribosomal protein L10 [Moorella mulderi]